MVQLSQPIQKIKIMASSSITSWQIPGKTMKTVTGFIYLGSKITADSAHSCEKKNALAPWKKSDEKPNSILKRGDIALPANVCIVKTMVLPEIKMGCELL